MGWRGGGFQSRVLAIKQHHITILPELLLFIHVERLPVGRTGSGDNHRSPTKKKPSSGLCVSTEGVRRRSSAQINQNK